MADVPSTTVVSPVAGPADELSRADTFFRQALQRDPELHEARIRRARVAAVRGRHADAVRELERAVAAPLPSALEYCARLFLGQSLQHVGRTAEAAAAFSRARELYPDALSPALALSQLARARGDLRGAVEALSLLQSRSSPVPGSDPWHEYHYTHQPTGEHLVERLRERWTR
jgi:tetratricopeptide (TPR) repeat protein